VKVLWYLKWIWGKSVNRKHELWHQKLANFHGTSYGGVRDAKWLYFTKYIYGVVEGWVGRWYMTIKPSFICFPHFPKASPCVHKNCHRLNTAFEIAHRHAQLLYGKSFHQFIFSVKNWFNQIKPMKAKLMLHNRAGSKQKQGNKNTNSFIIFRKSLATKIGNYKFML